MWPFRVLSPSVGDPREHRRYVALPPTFAPPPPDKARVMLPLLILSPSIGDPQECSGYALMLPIFGPWRT